MKLTDAQLDNIAHHLRTAAAYYSELAANSDANNRPDVAERFRTHNKEALTIARQIEGRIRSGR